jgi:glyoxylase-like metal-dependent hydrolase (beta-lactamase superfamily II)
MLEINASEEPRFSILSYIIRDTVSGECFIVDPHPGLIGSLDRDLKIKAVINTHIHFDHTLGNPAFRSVAPVWAHCLERRVLYYAANMFFTTLFSGRIPGRIDFRLTEGETLKLGDESISVMHTPGHSPGSLCLYWPGNLISGDTIFVAGVGRTDLPLGRTADLKDSVKRLMDYLPGDTLIWPGHNYASQYPITMAANRRALVWVLNNL